MSQLYYNIPILNQSRKRAERMKEEGKKVRVNFIADPELIEQAKLLAGLRGRSLSALICELMEMYIAKNKGVLQEQQELAKKLKGI